MMLVDYRRGSGELHKLLKRAGVPTKETTLTFGDFRFQSGPGYAPGYADSDTDGLVSVGVERKKIDEMLGAVHDSRFRRRQVNGLVNTYPGHAWLLVEGLYEPDAHGTLHQGRMFTTRKGDRMAVLHLSGFTKATHLYDNVAKFQHTLHLKAKLHPLRTISEQETVQALASLYRWYQKPFKDHKSIYVVDETTPDAAILTADSLKRRLAAQLPGVGWKYSKRVDDYFPSIESMFAATSRQWREALGFKEGMTVARNIVRQIRDLRAVDTP